MGIEVVGNYNSTTQKWDELSAAQIESTKNLVKRLMKRYGLNSDQILTHEGIQRKTPGEGGVVKKAIGF